MRRLRVGLLALAALAAPGTASSETAVGAPLLFPLGLARDGGRGL